MWVCNSTFFFFSLLLLPDVDTLSGGWVQTFQLLQDTPLSFRWDLERQIISGIPHLEAVQDRGAASSEKYTNMWDKVRPRVRMEHRICDVRRRVQPCPQGLRDSACKYLQKFFALHFTANKRKKGGGGGLV